VFSIFHQLEDPGHLSQIGYTGGAQCGRKLGWARNLLRKQTDAAANRLMYESSSAFVLFWNMLRNQLPDEILDDFDAWLKEYDMVRMDTKGSQDSKKGCIRSSVEKTHLNSIVPTCLHHLVSLQQTTQGLSRIGSIAHLLNNNFQVYTPRGQSTQVCSILDNHAGPPA
jgi:hypothetical protein